MSQADVGIWHQARVLPNSDCNNSIFARIFVSKMESARYQKHPKWRILWCLVLAWGGQGHPAHPWYHCFLIIVRTVHVGYSRPMLCWKSMIFSTRVGFFFWKSEWETNIFWQKTLKSNLLYRHYLAVNLKHKIKCKFISGMRRIRWWGIESKLPLSHISTVNFILFWILPFCLLLLMIVFLLCPTTVSHSLLSCLWRTNCKQNATITDVCFGYNYPQVETLLL